MSGTVEDNAASTTVSLGDTKNLVVRQTYIFPVNQIELTDITITATGTGDLALNNTPATVEQNGVTFNGNYATKTGDGSQYGIQASTGETPEIKQVSGATIGAFRAYLTGITASTAAKINIIDTTTGINSIHNSEFTIQNNEEQFNLAGQRVGKDYKGIVIVNGRKYIKK